MKGEGNKGKKEEKRKKEKEVVPLQENGRHLESERQGGEASINTITFNKVLLMLALTLIRQGVNYVQRWLPVLFK